MEPLKNEADFLSLFDAEVKNVWSFISTPPYVLENA
jgi:hypothetical protein